jgi:hypothetical protein
VIRRSASGAEQEGSVPLAQLLAPLLVRLRLRKAAEEVVSGALWALTALVLYALLRSFTSSAAILSAGQPLFLLGGIAIASIFCTRAIRKVSVAHAANEADARANLYDELKTAFWLEARQHRSSLESLQMKRADLTARHLDAPKLMPPFPRSRIALLLLLVLLGVMLMQLAPGALRPSAGLTAPLASAAGDTPGRAEKSAGAEPSARDEKAAVEAKVANAGQMPDTASEHEGAATADFETNLRAQDAQEESGGREANLTPQGEEDVEALFAAKGEHEDAAPPAKGGDPQPPAALSREANAPIGASPQAQASSNSSTAGNESALDTVFDRLSESARRVADGGGENSLTGAAEAKQKADDGDSNAPVQRNISKGDGQASEGAAAAPMSGQLQGEGAQGQGQGLPAEGSADSQHSGQMPEFATLTTTGGFGSPKASPIPGLKGLKPDAGKVEQLKRAEAQPRLVNIEAATGDTVRATDDFFTATRWQQSQLEFQPKVLDAPYVQGQMMDGERVPLALRSTVKSYFLILQQERK